MPSTAPSARPRLCSAPPASRDLIALARKFQIADADEAAGRCLSVSLELALAAQRRLDVEVQLVKWRVQGDPAYVDHWAVLLDDDNTIDLTRVQVDGSTQLVCRIADYPASYVNRRVYPASLLATAYAARRAPEALRLSNGFLWACGATLLRHDLAAALRHRDLHEARAALTEFTVFLTCFAFGGLTRALEKRASRLLGRLHRHAEPSARTAFGDLSEWGPLDVTHMRSINHAARQDAGMERARPHTPSNISPRVGSRAGRASR